MPRVTFGIIVLNGMPWLEPCKQSIAPYGPIVCAEGPVEWWATQGRTTSTDGTNEVLNKFGIPTVHGTFAEKDEESNAYMPLVPEDTEFLFMCDSDEIWDAGTLEGIFKALDSGDVDSMAFSPHTFYGGFERVLCGFEEEFQWHRVQRWYPGAKWATHRPPAINAPDGRPWREHRHVDNVETRRRGWRFAHPSYVLPSQVMDKVVYYRARNPDRVIPDYFQRVYLPWVLGNDIARRIIEDEFDGVHEWLPSLRGPCRTRKFDGKLPYWLRQHLPELQAQLETELNEYRYQTC